MNLVLSMLVIAGACFGICLWHTPSLLRRAAAHLLTRADVMDAAKAEHRRRLQFWCGELGVRENPAVESTASHPIVTHLAR